MIAVGEDGKFLPFQETMQRKRKYNISEMAGKIPLTIYLFDALVVEGKNIMNVPNGVRREKLEELVDRGKIVKLMDRNTAKNEKDIDEYFKTALKEGCEGIIAKKLDGVYKAGSRDFNWIKYKKSYDKSALSDTVDAVVMGYDVGQGKRAAFGIGDFLIGIFDEKKEKYLTVAKIGTGLTDDEWKRMKREVDEIKLVKCPGEFEVKKEMGVDVWAKPKIVVEVQADEITVSPMHSSGYALRFPRLISWREKKPTDSTSLKEVEKMYMMQRGEYGKQTSS
jgi:DNA ligase-1